MGNIFTKKESEIKPPPPYSKSNVTEPPPAPSPPIPTPVPVPKPIPTPPGLHLNDCVCDYFNNDLAKMQGILKELSNTDNKTPVSRIDYIKIKQLQVCIHHLSATNDLFKFITGYMRQGKEGWAFTIDSEVTIDTVFVNRFSKRIPGFIFTFTKTTKTVLSENNKEKILYKVYWKPA